MTAPKRPRLIAAIPIAATRKPTKAAKLSQRRKIDAWRRKAQRKDEQQ